MLTNIYRTKNISVLYFLYFSHMPENNRRPPFYFISFWSGFPPTIVVSIKRFSHAIGSLDRRVTSPLECWPSTSTHQNRSLYFGYVCANVCVYVCVCTWNFTYLNCGIPVRAHPRHLFSLLLAFPLGFSRRLLGARWILISVDRHVAIEANGQLVEPRATLPGRDGR